MPPQPQVIGPRPAFVKREAPRDLAFEDAVRALESILHPEEKATYAYIIRPALKPETQAKIKGWRQRNGLA